MDEGEVKFFEFSINFRNLFFCFFLNITELNLKRGGGIFKFGRDYIVK